MRVFTLGWEFPPHNLGGLGVACAGLTQELMKEGVSIILGLPRKQSLTFDVHEFVSVDQYANMELHAIDSLLVPYCTSSDYAQYLQQELHSSHLYGPHLFAEVERYAHVIESLCPKLQFDIIHAHDWMTFMAGIRVKLRTQKPLIAHVHATEFDRTGGNSRNEYVSAIEKRGLEMADRILTVSSYSKRKISEQYQIDSEKIAVIRNGTELPTISINRHKKNNHTVVFLGRLTLQKGPDYFVTMAQKIAAHFPHVRFIMAGTGDMEHRLIKWVIDAGMSNKFFFTGHLKKHDVDRLFQLADVYVMPSVAEPFGLTALEAMSNGAPLIVSKEAGVSEFIKNALSVDFWDIDEMAHKVIAVLSYDTLRFELRMNAHKEVQQFTWNEPARSCISVYHSCLT